MNYSRLKNIYDKNNENILPVKAWMFLEIHEKISEWDWNRIWKFKWLVISVKKPNHPDGTFTIRWPVARMTIEKIYPLSFKKFDKVLLLDDYKTRRSKLYYIREKVWKDARFKSKLTSENKDIDLVKWWKIEKKAEKVKKSKVEKAKIEEVKIEKSE